MRTVESINSNFLRALCILLFALLGNVIFTKQAEASNIINIIKSEIRVHSSVSTRLRYEKGHALQAATANNDNLKNCRCHNRSCGCCSHWQVDRIHLNATVCVNVTYLSKEYGLKFLVTIDDHVILNYTVSAKNPPPICVNVPFLKKLASLCIQFYDITYSRHHLRACVKITARLAFIPLEEIHLGCFTLPPLQPAMTRNDRRHLTFDMLKLHEMMKSSREFRDAIINNVPEGHSILRELRLTRDYGSIKRVKEYTQGKLVF